MVFDKKEWSKLYYLKRKSVFDSRAKKQHESGYHKKYYELNKGKINGNTLEWKKKKNYRDEKTPEQRMLRNIKRKTRYQYPLTKENKCELCGNGAQCHHHNTRPIKVDKFNVFCHKCHKGIHTQLNLIGGKHGKNRKLESIRK